MCVTPSVSVCVCDQCVYFQSGTKHIFVPEGGGILAKRRMPCSLFFFDFVFIEMKMCRKVNVLLFRQSLTQYSCHLRWVSNVTVT